MSLTSLPREIILCIGQYLGISHWGNIAYPEVALLTLTCKSFAWLMSYRVARVKRDRNYTLVVEYLDMRGWVDGPVYSLNNCYSPVPHVDGFCYVEKQERIIEGQRYFSGQIVGDYWFFSHAGYVIRVDGQYYDYDCPTGVSSGCSCSFCVSLQTAHAQLARQDHLTFRWFLNPNVEVEDLLDREEEREGYPTLRPASNPIRHVNTLLHLKKFRASLVVSTLDKIEYKETTYYQSR